MGKLLATLLKYSTVAVGGTAVGVGYSQGGNEVKKTVRTLGLLSAVALGYLIVKKGKK